MGVLLRDALLARDLVDGTNGLALTSAGRAWLTSLGVPADESGGRRPLLRDCLDWTERRLHLAGVLGAALCRRFAELGWTAPGVGRSVRITLAGARALADRLGLSPAELIPPGRHGGAGRA